MAPNEGGYGAVDDGGEVKNAEKSNADTHVVERDGWPSCDDPLSISGSRQGVLISCGVQEMQRALALSAVVSTLPVALFAVAGAARWGCTR
jgi:hypothetical protein